MLHMNLNIVRRLLWEHLKIHVFSLPQTKISAFSFFCLQSGWISNTGWFRVSSFCRFSISKPVLPDSCRLGVRSFALFRHGRLVSLMNWCRSVHKLTLPHAICNYRNAFTHFSLVTVIMELQVLKNSSTVRVLFLFTINRQNQTYDPLWSLVTWTNSPVRVKMCNYTFTVQISVFAQFFYCGK